MLLRNAVWLPRHSRAFALPAAAQQQVNVICPMPAEWCNLAATEFEKETGIKVALTLKGSGESFAQIAAEKANPKHDIWYGGTGDPHLQAAEQDLTDRVQVAAARSAAAVGQEAGRAIRLQDRRPLPRRARHGLQHRAAREEEGAGAGVLEGSRQARVQGRCADGQSECVGHRVHDHRHAGAGVRRGRGVQDAEGLEQEHQQLFASGRRPDQGDGARREHGRGLVHPRRRHRGAGRLPGARASRLAKAPATRSARCRSSRARAISTTRRSSTTGR